MRVYRGGLNFMFLLVWEDNDVVLRVLFIMLLLCVVVVRGLFKIWEEV